MANRKAYNFPCTCRNDEKFERVFANDTIADLTILLDINLPVNFIVHGFLDGFHGGFMKTGFIGWMDSTARLWTKAEPCNVCVVDWSRLATYEYLMTALWHTPKVAAHVVTFIRALEKAGFDKRQMSIAGHSLGAQISGKIGGLLNGMLLAIYGLDPAGPGFSFPFNDSPANVLDPSDAFYVQCIHTARMTFGVNYNCGHGDFYPDGGFLSPGCVGIICSHLRAPLLFRSALDRKHLFIGSHCTSDIQARYYAYQCSAIRDILGIYSERIKGSFYLTTISTEPYCINCSSVDTIEDRRVRPRQINAERRRPEPVPALEMTSLDNKVIPTTSIPVARDMVPSISLMSTLKRLPGVSTISSYIPSTSKLPFGFSKYVTQTEKPISKLEQIISQTGSTSAQPDQIPAHPSYPIPAVVERIPALPSQDEDHDFNEISAPRDTPEISHQYRRRAARFNPQPSSSLQTLSSSLSTTNNIDISSPPRSR